MSMTMTPVTVNGMTFDVPIYSCDLCNHGINPQTDPLVTVYRTIAFKLPDGSGEQFFGALNSPRGFVAYICPTCFQRGEIQMTGAQDQTNFTSAVQQRASMFPVGSPWNQPVKITGVNPTALAHGTAAQNVTVNGQTILAGSVFTLTNPSGTVTTLGASAVTIPAPAGQGQIFPPNTTAQLSVVLDVAGTWSLSFAVNGYTSPAYTVSVA